MRIISGTYKGRHIAPPKNFKARPTTDRAKESLFNVINNNYYFDEIKVLDLFGGTGSISYEFASRGCEDVTCVELNRKYADFIQKTADQIFGEGVISVFNVDAFKFLAKNSITYDIIFADPPYDSEEIERIPELVFENSMLNQDGWLILEHSGRIDFKNHPYLERTKKYGKVHFSYFSIPKPN